MTLYLEKTLIYLDFSQWINLTKKVLKIFSILSMSASEFQWCCFWLKEKKERNTKL